MVQKRAKSMHYKYTTRSGMPFHAFSCDNTSSIQLPSFFSITSTILLAYGSIDWPVWLISEDGRESERCIWFDGNFLAMCKKVSIEP